MDVKRNELAIAGRSGPHKGMRYRHENDQMLGPSQVLPGIQFRIQRRRWMFWAAAGLSAGLLELPFPLAGPMPPVRSVFAWFALVPLLWAVLQMAEVSLRALRHSFSLAYACGVLWYAGNCYWIYDTMRLHGDLSPTVAVLLLAGFSLLLGVYFGVFGLAIALVRRRFGFRWALASAPVFWTALELAGARFTGFPWDQLGYSQVDNHIAFWLAPWTGVYGISFVLVALNAFFAGTFLVSSRTWKIGAWAAIIALTVLGYYMGQIGKSTEPTTATAVLVQPNLDVDGGNDWPGPLWGRHIAEFTELAGEHCKNYIIGIPQPGAPTDEIVCPPNATHSDLVVWPEAPAPFFQEEPRFQQAAARIARATQAPLVVGGIGMDYSDNEQSWRDYNSAMLFGMDGKPMGRYDKIHLVPFGEFVPFEKLLFFAKKLTGRVSKFDRGQERPVFRIGDQNGHSHRYGIFICYEAVFADEVRHFAQNGAEVFVNISDDGWFGDTSAPWQHLNMARMRAIENHRWILRDTNNGVTAVIDPYGRVRQSIPRNHVDALPAQFGFREDVTFYTAHGDVFAWSCSLLGIAVVLLASRMDLYFQDFKSK